MILLEQNRSTTPYPKMEVINGRTLELFRRHQDGKIVDAIRAHGNSEDVPFIKDFLSPTGLIVWFDKVIFRTLTMCDQESIF